MVFCGLHHRASVGITQTPVGDYGVVSVVLQLFNGIPGGSGRSYCVAGRFQNGALQRNYVGLIIDAEDFGHNERP